MPSPSEIVRAAHSTLSSLVEHVDFLDDAEGKHKSAQAQLTATAMELSMASRRLEAVKVELKKAEADLAGKHHVINDEAARALQDVNRQVAAQQEELRKLDSQIKERKADLDNVVAGMAALHQRLRV